MWPFRQRLSHEQRQVVEEAASCLNSILEECWAEWLNVSKALGPMYLRAERRHKDSSVLWIEVIDPQSQYEALRVLHSYEDSHERQAELFKSLELLEYFPKRFRRDYGHVIDIFFDGHARFVTELTKAVGGFLSPGPETNHLSAFVAYVPLANELARTARDKRFKA